LINYNLFYILGMVWRWLVGSCCADTRVALKVQALPCSLATIKATPALRLDSTRGIIVAEFNLGYKTFQNLPGPVPTYFSDKPDVTSEELKKSPKFAFDCMQTLLSRLLDTEQITKEQAEAYLGNPTIGRTRTPLVKTWESVMGKTDPKTLEGKILKTCNYVYIQLTHKARIKKIIKTSFSRSSRQREEPGEE